MLLSLQRRNLVLDFSLLVFIGGIDSWFLRFGRVQLEKILAQRVNIALFDILLLDQFADLVFNVLVLFGLFFRPIRNVDECKCQNRG